LVLSGDQISLPATEALEPPDAFDAASPQPDLVSIRLVSLNELSSLISQVRLDLVRLEQGLDVLATP